MCTAVVHRIASARVGYVGHDALNVIFCVTAVD
jgi:hypothetical protein